MKKFHNTKNIYLGYSHTVNSNARFKENGVEEKIVALKQVNVGKKLIEYKPLFDYEYHSVFKKVPIARFMKDDEVNWLISDDHIKEIIPRTGLVEANTLGNYNKVEAKEEAQTIEFRKLPEETTIEYEYTKEGIKVLKKVA